MEGNSRLMYLDKLGVYVGDFTKEEVAQGIDKQQEEKFKELTGCKYTNSTIATDINGNKVLRVWVCDLKDCKDLIGGEIE